MLSITGSIRATQSEYSSRLRGWRHVQVGRKECLNRGINEGVILSTDGVGDGVGPRASNPLDVPEVVGRVKEPITTSDSGFGLKLVSKPESRREIIPIRVPN